MAFKNLSLSFDQFLLLLVAVLFLAIIGFIGYSIFTRPLDGFSAVYLPQHPQTDIQLNQAVIVEFLIENHEGMKKDYFYEIYFDDEKLLDKLVSVDNNQTLQVTEYFQSLDSFDGKKKLLIKVYPFDEKTNAFAKDPFELWFWTQEIE